MKNDKLDKLLKDWDKQLEPKFADKSKLKQAVLDQIQKPEQGLKGKGQYFIIHRSFVYYAAIAASFVVVIGAVFMMMNKKTPPPQADSPMIALSNNDLKELQTVRSEVDRVFPEGVAWVFKCKNQMEITPADDASGSEKSKLLIHHVVVKKVDGKWKKVYVADVMTRTGQQIYYDKDSDNKTYLWTHKLDQNRFALEGQLKIKANGMVLDVEFIGGQELNKPYLLKTVKKNNSEYRIYQILKKM